MVELPEFTEEQEKLRDELAFKTFLACDHELEMFLNMMFGSDDENEGVYFGMTFVVEGAVVSGTAISEKDWSRGFNEALTEAGVTNPAEDRKRIANLVAEGLAAMEKPESNDSEWPKSPRRYIHLLNATTGQGMRLLNARLDLRKVSAWSFGGWTPATPEG